MIELKKIATIENPRLVLREFNNGDAKFMFENYGHDYDNINYMLWKGLKNIADAQKSIEYFKKCYKENLSFRQYAIALKDSNEVIGQISFDANLKHHNAELAYVLSRKYQKQGYMTEAINSILKYLQDLNFKRISAEVMIENVAGINILKKCGFKKEGILHCKYINKQNEFTDVILFSKIIK